jgi:hypothetical protein
VLVSYPRVETNKTREQRIPIRRRNRRLVNRRNGIIEDISKRGTEAVMLLSKKII